jgi:hypothetical protein
MTRQHTESDERYGATRLGPLAGEPDTVSLVDLSRAVTVGRRRKRVRRAGVVVALASVATVAVLAGLPAATGVLERLHDKRDASVATTVTPLAGPTGGARPAPSACVAAFLPMPTDDGEETVVSGGDPSGRWLIGRTRASDGDGNYINLIWKDGALVGRPELPGANQELHDINSAGTAVGEATSINEFGINGVGPYVYRKGAVQKLRGVDHGVATAINDAGTIVGVRSTSDGKRRAVRWKSATAAGADLPMPSGFSSAGAVGLAEDGTVLGSVEAGNGPTRAYVWRPDGTGTLLPNPKVGGQTATEFDPIAIRGGFVIGTARLPGDNTRLPFRYNVVGGTFDQPTEPATTMKAVNSSGWVVGRLIADQEALFNVDGQNVPLPRAIFDNSIGNIMSTSISDDGRTVGGWGLTATDQSRPVVWTCQ